MKHIFFALGVVVSLFGIAACNTAGNGEGGALVTGENTKGLNVIVDTAVGRRTATETMTSTSGAAESEDATLPLPIPAGGNIVYVVSGASGGDGTKENPLGSIQEGIMRAEDRIYKEGWENAQVFVREGRYEISETINMKNIPVYAGFCASSDWTSRDAARCKTQVIETRCGGTNIIAMFRGGRGLHSERSIIDGFTLSLGSCATEENIFAGFHLQEGSALISNNHIRLSPSLSEGLSMGASAGPERFSFHRMHYGILAENNNETVKIVHNQINPMAAKEVYGIKEINSNIQIVGNEIICSSRGNESYGINNVSGRSAVIVNNTISCNSSTGFNNGIANFNTNSVIRNNTIFGGATKDSVGISIAGTSAPVIENNIIYTSYGVRGTGIYMVKIAREGDLGAFILPAGFLLRNNLIFGDILYKDGATPVRKLGLTSARAVESALGTVVSSGNTDRDLGIARCFNHSYRIDTAIPGCDIDDYIGIFTGGLNYSSADWEFTSDKDGKTRTNGGGRLRNWNWSMGAYEYDITDAARVVGPGGHDRISASVSPADGSWIQKGDDLRVTFSKAVNCSTVYVGGSMAESGRVDCRGRNMAILPPEGGGWNMGMADLVVYGEGEDGIPMERSLRASYGVQTVFVSSPLYDTDRDRDNGTIYDPAHSIKSASDIARAQEWFRKLILVGEGEHRIAAAETINLDSRISLSGGACADSGRWNAHMNDLCKTTIRGEICVSGDSAAIFVVHGADRIPIASINGVAIEGDREGCVGGTRYRAAILVEEGMIQISDNSFRSFASAAIINRNTLDRDDSVLIENNKITEAGYAVYNDRARGTTIRNNTIDGIISNNGAAGERVNNNILIQGNTIAGGILNRNVRSVEIRGNKINKPTNSSAIDNNNSQNIAIDSNHIEFFEGVVPMGEVAIKIVGSANVRVHNNTIYNPGFTNATAILDRESGSYVRNNTIVFDLPGDTGNPNNMTLINSICSATEIQNNYLYVEGMHNTEVVDKANCGEETRSCQFLGSFTNNHVTANQLNIGYFDPRVPGVSLFRCFAHVGIERRVLADYTNLEVLEAANTTYARNNIEGYELVPCLDKDLKLDERKAGCAAENFTPVFTGGHDGPEDWRFATDKEGRPRTGDGDVGWSIGAYEYD